MATIMAVKSLTIVLLVDTKKGEENPKTMTHMVTFSGKGLRQFAEK